MQIQKKIRKICIFAISANSKKLAKYANSKKNSKKIAFLQNMQIRKNSNKFAYSQFMQIRKKIMPIFLNFFFFF